MPRTPEQQRQNSLKYSAKDPRRTMPRKVTREIIDAVIRLYRAGLGCGAIEGRLKAMGLELTHTRIWTVLRKSGVATRQLGSKGVRCVDCSKPTNGAKRCKLHARIRNAEMQRLYWRNRHGLKHKLDSEQESA